MSQTTPEQVKPKVEPRPRVTPPKPDQLVSVPSSAALKVPVKITQQPKPPQNQARPKVEEKVEVTENGSRRFRCGICDIGFRFQVRILMNF